MVPEVLDEEKHAEFVRLAESRMSMLLSDMESKIKVLASRERYEYTEEEWREMVNAIREKTDQIEAAFREGGRRKPKVAFKFGGGAT